VSYRGELIVPIHYAMSALFVYNLIFLSLVTQSIFTSADAFILSFTGKICTLSIHLILRNLALLDEFLLTKSLFDSVDGNDAFVPGNCNRALGAHLGVDAHGETPGQC
jgi:hypothetical protein